MHVKDDNQEQITSNMNSNSEKDETGAIGISLGLTAIAAAIIYGAETSLTIKIICLIIYILGGLSTSFLYFSFLTNTIPDTVKLWMSKGGLGVKGIFWIFWYYTKLLFRQMVTLKGNTIPKIRELGYLTIFAMLFILWGTFLLIILQIVLELKIINVAQWYS